MGRESMILNNWTKDQSVGDADWTTVYTADLKLVNVYGFVFQVSSEKMDLRFEAPGLTWDMDLWEVSHDYMLDSSSSKQVPQWIYTTGMGRFVVDFPEPMQLQGVVSVKLKSKSGTKSLYRGFISRGLR